MICGATGMDAQVVQFRAVRTRGEVPSITSSAFIAASSPASSAGTDARTCASAPSACRT